MSLSEYPENRLHIVVDENGKTANTRAYWREEFEKSKAIANVPLRRICYD